jgi:hypothetical protein
MVEHGNGVFGARFYRDISKYSRTANDVERGVQGRQHERNGVIASGVNVQNNACLHAVSLVAVQQLDLPDFSVSQITPYNSPSDTSLNYIFRDKRISQCWLAITGSRQFTAQWRIAASSRMRQERPLQGRRALHPAVLPDRRPRSQTNCPR